MSYGVQPTGFVRKPLAVILAEIEQKMILAFGNDVIQTPQSPLGQINGIFAEQLNAMWELAEDIYQSYDPAQAEGLRLDTAAKIRLLTRNSDTDTELRKKVTNESAARILLSDFISRIKAIAGVEYANVFLNETATTDTNGMPAGAVSLAVIGGDNTAIATVMQKFIMPGIPTYGNSSISGVAAGRCRPFKIIRPTGVRVRITQMSLRFKDLGSGCPKPPAASVKNRLAEEWRRRRENGLDVSHFSLRKILEYHFPSLELESFTAATDTTTYSQNAAVPISFLEIASLTQDDITLSMI